MSYPPQQGPYGNHYQQRGHGYPYPGQEPYGYPPRKRNTGLIVGLVVGAVLLLGGGALTLVLVLSGEDGPSQDPRQFAASYVTAVNERDPEALVALSCSLGESDGQYAIREFTEQRVEVTLSEEPAMESGRDVAFWLDVTRGDPQGGEPPQRRYRLLLMNETDRWCALLGAGGMPS
ncbi:hypothetical protein [Amycolatopsis cihanbeyliensis]|uniref:DUF4878 domain-containing protein n=1 Tax=Amycolatopsis cihanbeyliensis TaxID=1128664 RepID=A0A542DKZ3_AMYCI|nr:hypothetical protein [Amycolatopsis cihanbeyliensis]TQJ03767.1 hypothetical protein FB471_3535 [Amycolatopsis cihanbeyliensis]